MADTDQVNKLEMGCQARREFIKAHVLRAINFGEEGTTRELNQEFYTRLGVAFSVIADQWEDELINNHLQNADLHKLAKLLPQPELPSSTVAILNVYSAIADMQELAKAGKASDAIAMTHVVRHWKDLAAVLLIIESKKTGIQGK